MNKKLILILLLLGAMILLVSGCEKGCKVDSDCVCKDDKCMIKGFMLKCIKSECKLVLGLPHEVEENSSPEEGVVIEEPEEEVVVEEETNEENNTEELNETEEVELEEVNEETVEEEKVWNSSGILKVHFINVGQGDAILIETPKAHSMMIDGGTNTAAGSLTKYLQNHDIFELDMVIASTIDTAHIGGLDSVLFNIPVEDVYDNGITINSNAFSSYNSLANTKNHITVDDDFELNLDDSLEINVYAPYDLGEFDNMNDNAIVVRIQYHNVSFLLTGGCAFECEQTLLQYGDRNLQADILKVGHFGDIESTSPEFFNAVRPSVAVISLDALHFEEPNPNLLNMFNEKGVEVYRTDLNGSIVVSTNGVDINVSFSI